MNSTYYFCLIPLFCMQLTCCNQAKLEPRTIDSKESASHKNTSKEATSATEGNAIAKTESDVRGSNGDCTMSQVTIIPAPPAAPKRPRIFMALHGSNRIATNAADDEAWSYVREHLDGIWGNNANVSALEELALWRKLKTRTLITEWDSVAKQSFVSPHLFGGATDNDPSMVINREAIALYTSAASDWNGTTIGDANANYVNNTARPDRVFKAVYTGWQPQSFQGAGLTGDALNAFNGAKGVFLECDGDACSNEPLKSAFENAIKMAHANNQVFIWFNGTSTDAGWMEKSKNRYNQLMAENVLLPTDVVMIINYGGAMTPTPEVDAQGNPANTVTGMLYWLLHQGIDTAPAAPTPITATPCKTTL